jgi:hypothetical protein
MRSTVAERIFLGAEMLEKSGSCRLPKNATARNEKFLDTHARLRSDRFSLCRAQSEVTEKGSSRAGEMGGDSFGRDRGTWVDSKGDGIPQMSH